MKSAEKNIILVATSDQSDFESLQVLLEKRGIEAIGCVDGIDLVRKACTLMPRAIILGSNVGKLNAFQCARILKNDPVLSKINRVCFAPLTPIEQYWSTVCGFDMFISYPFNENTAMEVIDQLPRKKSQKHLFQSCSLLSGLDDDALLNMALTLAEQELLKANILNEINMIDVVALTFDDLIYAVMSILNSLFDFDVGAVMIIQQKADEIIFYINGESSPNLLLNNKQLAAEYIQQKHGIAVNAELVRERIVKEEPEIIRSDQNDLYFHTSEKIGICSLFLLQGLDYDELVKDEQLLLETALDLCQSVVDKKIYFQKSQELSIIDAGTGGLSTAFFYTILEREVNNAERCGYPLILFSIKIEDFARFAAQTKKPDFDKPPMAFLNELILKACRKSDIVARLETTTFVFLVTYIPMDKAQIAQNRIFDFIKAGINNYVTEGINDLQIKKTICQFDPARHNSIEQLVESVW